MQFPPQCVSGLVCKYNPQDARLMGRRGRCQKPDDDNDTPAQPNAPLQPGQLGDACGGDWNYSMQCGQGLTCHLYSDNALRGGVCVPLSQIGEKCGGAIRYPPVCTPNAQCQSPADPIPGAFGTCVEVFAQEHEECGGGIRYAKRCDAGLICVNLTGLAGAKGKCYKRSDDATETEVSQ